VALPYSHIEPEHTWEATASNNHVVEGIKLFGATVAMVDGGAECHAWLGGPALRMKGVERWLNLKCLSARKEADLAQIHAKERGGSTGDGRGGAQEGAITTE
jgi:hypothetical protein